MYYLVLLLSPYLPIPQQSPKLYIATQEELDRYSADTIRVGSNDLITSRYLLGWEQVEVIEQYTLTVEEQTEEVVETIRGRLKVIYSSLVARVYIVKTQNNYYRGYYIDLMKDLAIVTKDGYIPLDKERNVGNVEVIKYNKRVLIKRPNCVHNQLQSILGVVDESFNKKDIKQSSDIDLGKFIDSF